MTKLRNFFGLVILSLLFFTACKKENVDPTQNQNPSISNVKIDPATQTRAMAAAASVANARNSNDTTQTDCGCYDLFADIDFDASHDEVEKAIDAALEGLSEAEIDRLFEPVCTDDGNIYESACIADCEGISNYHTCSDEELEDYFFDDFDCKDLENLTFPAEIELPDGTKVTVNSEEELWNLLEKWYEENGGDWDDEEWGHEDFDFEDCFTVIFPIQVQFPEGEIISYDSEDALYAGIEAWFEQNPNSKEEPMPVYPFEVLLPDSSKLTINTEMEEEALWGTCFGDIDFELCFEVNYPITLVYPDSSILAVNSDEALEKAVDDYYEANPDTEADIDVQYPITITLSDGSTQNINDEDELEEAIDDCFDDFHKVSNSNQRKTMLSARRVAKGAFLSGSGR